MGKLYGWIRINGWYWIYDRKEHFTLGYSFGEKPYKNKQEILNRLKELNLKER